MDYMRVLVLIETKHQLPCTSTSFTSAPSLICFFASSKCPSLISGSNEGNVEEDKSSRTKAGAVVVLTVGTKAELVTGLLSSFGTSFFKTQNRNPKTEL